MLEIAYPAPISVIQEERLALIANLDASNILRSLEILASTLRTVSLPPSQ